MKPTTPQTRRAILGAIGLAVPVAVAGGMAGTSAAMTTPRVSPDLAALLEAEQRAQKACDHHESAVCTPTRDRWLAACEALPHTTVEMEALNPSDPPHIWTTADEAHVRAAKRISWMGERSHPDTKNARALAAAFHRRERAKSALAVRMGLKAAIARSDALGEQSLALLDALLAFPAATAIDLQAKLTRLVEVGYLEIDGAAEIILADVNRIAAREG